MKAELSINLEAIETMGEKLYPTNLGIVVLRELIQNSLDADATFIDIELGVDDNKIATLSVLDNGIGIADYNKYFLQIGNISDQKKENSIGGFGMAKLALLSCTTLEVVSVGGYFNKTMLFNTEESIDESVTTQGTMITVTIPDNKTPWNYESYIRSYLKTIKTDVTLIFNEEEITHYELIDFYAKKSKEIGFESEYNNSGEVVIRVNGLPTIYEYVYGLNGISLIYDIITKLNPNGGDYPLCTNRESLNKSWSGYQDYRLWLENIRASIEDQKELEEVMKAEIMVANYNNMLLSGGATKESLKENIKLVKVYKKYVLAVLNCIDGNNSHENIKFGITADNNTVAAYVSQVSGFFINPNCTLDSDKSKILSLAIHECTHWQGYDEHNIDFARSMTEITTKVFYALQSRQIKL